MASMEQGATVVQYGPYGSQKPQSYSWKVSDSERISAVIVNHGFVVDAIGFELTRPDGSTYIVRFGGNTPNPSTVSLKSGEYVTGFSGQYGYDRDRKQVGVVKMKVCTNLCPQGYGPFGLAEDVDNITDFHSPLQHGWPLVGVFGTCDGNLESIGVYLREQGPPIVQYGPYGSQKPQSYSWKVSDSERISAVIVNHGFVVDAIGFELTRPDGSTYIVRFGGNTPNPSTVSLKSGEYVTGFSGQYGDDKDRKQVGVVKMKVYTNLCPQGYGPFGLAEDVDNIIDFQSPLQHGRRLVGVFGACNDNLESIGVYLREV